MPKSPQAFRTISEIASELDVPQHVLRFWEAKFTQIKPLRRGGGRRYYRPEDVDLIRGIRRLLYNEGYTIKGVQKVLREQGIRFVADTGRGGSAPGPMPNGSAETDLFAEAEDRPETLDELEAEGADAGEFTEARIGIDSSLRDILEEIRADLEAARALLRERLDG